MKMEPIVQKFYNWLDEDKIMGRKCVRCGAVEFPPVILCNACSGTELEWVEISGKAEMFSFVMPGTATAKPEFGDLMPYCFACVRLEEGAEVNAVVRGVTRKNKQELMDNLPVPITAAIYQREGYKTVVFDLVQEQE